MEQQGKQCKNCYEKASSCAPILISIIKSPLRLQKLHQVALRLQQLQSRRDFTTAKFISECMKCWWKDFPFHDASEVSNKSFVIVVGWLFLAADHSDREFTSFLLTFGRKKQHFHSENWSWTRKRNMDNSSMITGENQSTQWAKSLFGWVL